MNPVRIIERIGQLDKIAFGPSASGRLPLLTLPSGWHLLLSRLSAHEDMGRILIENNQWRMPFPSFTYWLPGYKCPANHDSLLDQWGVVRVSEDRRSVSIAGESKYPDMDVIGNRLFKHRVSLSDSGQKLDLVQFYMRGKWHRVPNSDADAKCIGFGGMGHEIFEIAYHYQSGAMHPVEVSPCRKQGKSVEWVKARSFYSVVHRSHPANNATVKEESIVSGRHDCMQRSAHSRRAHFRILRSARWGASTGKLVWVRSAWVGPREWIDEASRQIYRVADLNP